QAACTPPPSGVPSVPTSAGPSGQPPRPPSWFSVRDARQRAHLPPQSPSSSLSLPSPSSVIGMAPHSSPILASSQVFETTEAETRRVRLEERQAALAEKQRLLHSQFAQQLAPN
ncbi:hypothetical protein PMAYCL1PPCAC_14419, partial [Pristionchus mayeri]